MARRGDAATAHGLVQSRGRSRGDSVDRGPRRYGSKGRRSYNAGVGATSGAALGQRRGPRAATLRPEGVTQRRCVGMCSHGEKHGATELRPNGAMQQQLVALSEGRAILGTIFTDLRRRTQATD